MRIFKRTKTYDEAYNGSLLTKITSTTLAGSLILGTVLFIIGLGLYSTALIRQYITESFSIARSSSVVVEQIADTDALAREVLDIYHSTPEERKACNG